MAAARRERHPIEKRGHANPVRAGMSEAHGCFAMTDAGDAPGRMDRKFQGKQWTGKVR